MSQILTVELSEQVLSAIQQQAQTLGISTEQLAVTLLEQWSIQTIKLSLDEAAKNAARARFERHFGTLEVNELLNLENESIDADLARGYTNFPHDRP